MLNASETESHQFNLVFDLAQKYQEQLYAESHGTNNEAEASIYDIAYYTEYCLHECECMLFSYSNTYDTSLHEEFPIEPKRLLTEMEEKAPELARSREILTDTKQDRVPTTLMLVGRIQGQKSWNSTSSFI